eukprot:CAMPEP_0185254696 /NCGR_PEP_ID=MMETSP1359-20130426/3596_1 /TAXON_ID=552665 /ORGANISM="Bigelowiella longifila, Strain CCMP242" /LENGTH=281 /DNA_ID=CAMNT_0027837981 /DNA_START=327 /DNA_END=1172 /DNA_ORIENTATION=+
MYEGGEPVSSSIPPMAAPKLGFSFSASGLMMPYHCGVGTALRDAGFLHDGTPLAGSSGGAITAAAFACGLPSHEIINGIEAVAKDCRENGSFRRMLIPARELCEKVLPEDAHHLMNGRARVSILQVLPRPKRLFIEHWDSKNDVVDSLMASSNIPAILAPSLLVPFRGGFCIDGSFATKIGSFGCGDSAAQRTVRVMAFDPKDFGGLANLISQAALTRDAIAPGLREGDSLPISTSRALRLAAGSPPPDFETIMELYRAGYLAAELWVEEELKFMKSVGSS